MSFIKSLCLRCYRRKYQGRSFVTYLKDLEPADQKRCDDCGEPAEVQVEIQVETHMTTDPHRFLSYWASLVDFTTLTEASFDDAFGFLYATARETSALVGCAQPGEKAEVYLDEIGRLSQMCFDAILNHTLETTTLHEILHGLGASDDFVRCVLKWLKEA